MKLCFLLVFSTAFSASVGAQEAWIIGQSVPLTGANAAFGKDIRDGALAYFKAVNRAGGVAGRPVELRSLDDRNDRKQAGLNTQQLLESKSTVALFGYASATLSLDAMPQAEEAKTLFFAPFTGANPVRKSSPVVFTLRASYGQELEKMLAFWTSVGMKQVVVMHYDDEVGRQNLQIVVDVLAKQDKTPVPLSFKRNEPVTPAQVTALVNLKPDVLINTTLSDTAAQVSRKLAERNRLVPMSSLSFVGAQQYINAAGVAGAGVSITQVVPGVGAALPVVRECAKALAESDLPGLSLPMNSTHLESCIAAKVLTEALQRVKRSSDRTGDRAALLTSMQNLSNYDTGGFVVNYTPRDHHGSSYVGLAMVTREGKLR
jgi:branched-chain amino acid transport system substrate-binding protein